MENNWERRKENLVLDFPTILKLLKPIFPDKKPVEITLLSGGLVNTNYKIKLENLSKPVLIRIFTRDLTACQKEYNIFKLVKQKIKVPEIYFADFKGEFIDYPYSITEFIEGTSLKDSLENNNLDMAIEIGQLLAKIHSFKFEDHGFFSEDLKVNKENCSSKTLFTGYMHSCLENPQVKRRVGDLLLEQLTDFIRQNEVYLDNYTNYSLLHADFKPTNIFINEGKISAILDWEFAFSGIGVFDIGQFLRYSDYFISDFEINFIKGYKDISNDLTDYWKKSAKFIDITNLLGFLITDTEKPVLFGDIICLLQGTMNDWDTY